MVVTKTGKSKTGNRVQRQVRAEKATIADAQQLHDLVNAFAQRGEMLPRTMGEVYETLRDFFVVRQGQEILACVALHITWEGLAEVRSLAVREESQAVGLGTLLVEACVGEARTIGLKTVFALTSKPGVFERLGFRQADVMALPRKVWNECYRCPKFPNCDEVAMVLDPGEGPGT
jgi:amino-acid N-acetyltransferase